MSLLYWRRANCTRARQCSLDKDQGAGVCHAVWNDQFPYGGTGAHERNPSVIGLGEALKKDYEGKMIIVDGFEGKVYIEPDYTTITRMKQKQDEKHPCRRTWSV